MNNTENWEQLYHSNSEYEEEVRDSLLESLNLDGVLNYRNITEDDRDRAIEQEFEMLASQYADEHDTDLEEVNYDDVLRYIQSKEKGVALGPLSNVSTSGQILTDIKDIYEEVAEENELTEMAGLVESFYQDVPQKYDPENNDEYNENTDLDLMRLQHDIAAGGRAFAYALRDTSDVFDELAREEIMPEMIGEIARKDEEGEYVNNLIDQLEIFIENNVENYFEENFGDRIVDIEQKIEGQGDDIENLIGRVAMLEGSVTAIDDITSEISDIYNILGNHSDQLDDVTDRLGDLEDRMDDYDDKLANLESDLHDYVDAEISQLEADIGVELTNLAGDMSDLDSRVSNNESDISNHRSRINTLERDLSDLESTVSALEGLEGRVDSLEGRMDSTERKIDEYENRLNVIEGDLDDVYDTLADHETRLNDLEEGTGRDDRVDDIQEHLVDRGRADMRAAEELDKEIVNKGLLKTAWDYIRG